MADNGHRVDGFREPATRVAGSDGVPRQLARIFTRDADEHHAWIVRRLRVALLADDTPAVPG